MASSCLVYVGVVKSAFEDVNVGSFLTFRPTTVEDQIETPTLFHEENRNKWNQTLN